MENRPRISRWIGRGYLLLTVLFTVLFATISLNMYSRGLFYPASIFVVVMLFVLILLGLITYGFYNTRYVVEGGFLRSNSPFAKINLKLKDIKKIETTRVPFYFKGWGASLYSGRFYIPGLGWAKVIITNLTDGVLITDKVERHYLITPSNPASFVKSLK